MTDFHDRRQGSFANSANGFTPMGPMIGQHGTTDQAHRAQPFLSTGTPMQDGDFTVAALAHGSAGMDLHPQFGGTPPKFYLPGQPQVLYQHMPQIPAHAHMARLMSQAAYCGYPQQTVDHSPVSINWTPGLSNANTPTGYTSCRDSFPSNETDQPATPFSKYDGYQGGLAVYDRSPSMGFSHGSTLSSSQLGVPYGIPQVGKTPPSNIPIQLQLQLLVQQHPAIPKAILAPGSPLKHLNRALENTTGETNVYIRGLQLETTDEVLHSWGSRFGDIVSSKAIVDLKTNLCKGCVPSATSSLAMLTSISFGFIRYHNLEDANDCIRGFHFLGYEVSFAREPFHFKLKALSDESNTNLYVSNIPKNMDERELASVFAPYKVCSARVLRDPRGDSRGIGFARFESREVCEEIIKNFNNTPVSKPGGEEHLIQIRYSDTHEQKVLKQYTAAARAFRAHEYERGVMQARNGALLASDHQAALPGAERQNEFQNYLQTIAGFVEASL
ncbi:hypothetical protein H2201_008476 [Coniosporium apollinis]|uniref:RRM domain-containing protein n=1 Tax=Coniosporium apollinis TaxID=61459 RepID=A0ABQ9NIK6_9PEZI|nr:hypothetical protein H2201_008476 [Coniosporium apollinis]